MIRIQHALPPATPSSSSPRASTSTTLTLPTNTSSPAARSQAERSLLSLLERGDSTTASTAVTVPRSRARARSLSSAPTSRIPVPTHHSQSQTPPPAPNRVLRPEPSLDLDCDLGSLVERSIALQSSPPRRSHARRAHHPYRPTFTTVPTSTPLYDSSSSDASGPSVQVAQANALSLCYPQPGRKPLNRRATAPCRPTTPTRIPVPIPAPAPIPSSPKSRSIPRSQGIHSTQTTPTSTPSHRRLGQTTSPKPTHPPLASAITLAAATALSSNNTFVLRGTSRNSNTIASRRNRELTTSPTHSRPSSPKLNVLTVSNHTVIEQKSQAQAVPRTRTPEPHQPKAHSYPIPQTHTTSTTGISTSAPTRSPRSGGSGSRSPRSSSSPFTRPQSPISTIMVLTPEIGSLEIEPQFDVERAERRLRGQTGRVCFSEVVPPPEDEEEGKRHRGGRRWSLALW